MRQAHPGFVYAILAPEVNRVKIGHAVDPHRRLAALQMGCPTELVMHSMLEYRDAPAMEAATHYLLQHARVRGEWFDVEDWMVAQWLDNRKAGREPFDNNDLPSSIKLGIDSDRGVRLVEEVWA